MGFALALLCLIALSLVGCGPDATDPPRGTAAEQSPNPTPTPSPHQIVLTCPARALIPQAERPEHDASPWRYEQVKVTPELQDLLCLASGASDPLGLIERAGEDKGYRYDPNRSALAVTVTLALTHATPTDLTGAPERLDPDELPAAVTGDPCWAEVAPYLLPTSYTPDTRRLRTWVRVDRVMQLAACDPVASIRLTAVGVRAGTSTDPPAGSSGP